MADKTKDLCVKCAAELREGFTLTRTSGGIDNKVTCASCGKRRYGATYTISKRESSVSEVQK